MQSNDLFLSFTGQCLVHNTKNTIILNWGWWFCRKSEQRAQDSFNHFVNCLEKERFGFISYVLCTLKERVESIIQMISVRERGLSTYWGVKITIRELRIQLTWIIAVVITDFTPCDGNNLWWLIWGLPVFYGLCVCLAGSPFVICFTQVHFDSWSLLLPELLPLLLLFIFLN